MPLKQCILELSKSCNLNCGFCFQSAGARRAGEINESENLKILESLKANGIKIVTMMGGEPTIIPYFPNILQRAIDLKFSSVNVQTNGTVYFPFKDYACNVAVSLESGNALEDEMVRGNPELVRKINEATGLERRKLEDELLRNDWHYHRARAMLNPKDNKWISLSKNHPIWKATIFQDNNIVGSAQTAMNMGVSQFLCMDFKPFGSSAANPQLQPPSAERLAQIFYELNQMNEKYITDPENPPIYIEMPQWQFYNRYEFARNAHRVFEKEPNPCPAGTRRMYIDSFGHVFPCHFLGGDKEHDCGSIITDDFQTIKKNLDDWRKRIDELKLNSQCKKCPPQIQKMCGGGCRLYGLQHGERGDTNCPFPYLGIVEKVK